jgi:cytoskeletal protein CcmA (bactofilin family)
MFGKKAQPPIKGLLAQGCRIEGLLVFTEGMRIDGEVAGDVRGLPEQPSLLVLSETAVVEGEVRADHVIVNGRVKGPIIAAEVLELQPRAQVEGDIQYRILEVHPGATICGQLRALPTEEEKPLLKLAASNA